MLPPGKVACKVVLVDAAVATDVALEGVLVAVAAHVYGVEDVVGEGYVTVLAVVLRAELLGRGGQARGRGAGLAVADAGGAGAAAALAAWPRHGTTLARRERGEPGVRGRGRRGVRRVGQGRRRGRVGGVGLLYEEGLLVHRRPGPGRPGGLGCLGVDVRRKAGQLTGQRR